MHNRLLNTRKRSLDGPEVTGHRPLTLGLYTLRRSSSRGSVPRNVFLELTGC
jgi:hypothetical protein